MEHDGCGVGRMLGLVVRLWVGWLVGGVVGRIEGACVGGFEGYKVGDMVPEQYPTTSQPSLHRELVDEPGSKP